MCVCVLVATKIVTIDTDHRPLYKNLLFRGGGEEAEEERFFVFWTRTLRPCPHSRIVDCSCCSVEKCMGGYCRHLPLRFYCQEVCWVVKVAIVVWRMGGKSFDQVTTWVRIFLLRCRGPLGTQKTDRMWSIVSVYRPPSCTLTPGLSNGIVLVHRQYHPLVGTTKWGAHRVEWKHSVDVLALAILVRYTVSPRHENLDVNRLT